MFGLVLVIGSLLLQGCVYFNTFFNAQKAYDQAKRLQDNRFEKNPEDSTLVSSDEKVKLERSIAKASKVLELFPKEKKYQPKALFLIGESFLAMGEYPKAILKYEELQRFYPQAEEMPVAEFHRGQALFLNGQYSFARTALEKVLRTTQDSKIKEDAMVIMAQLEVKSDSPVAALELYEKLLATQARTPEAKANVRLQAAKLAFDLKQWDRARKHACAPEIKLLPSKLLYRAETLAADCLYNLKRTKEGIAEFELMLKNRLYSTFFPQINLKLAEGYFQIGNPSKALEILTAISKNVPKTPFAAEAFFRLGEYQLVELKNEKAAKILYDSAAATGSMFEYAKKALDRSQALAKLANLRNAKDTAVAKTHYRDFMIAELFLFKLDNLDSALLHLDQIIQDPRQDSSHSMRAAYARAFIQQEFKQDKSKSDSLYKFVLEKYPKTEYAKQAERNLGLIPSVLTSEDEAHKLFLEAEGLRFGGGDLAGTVIPAYAKVVASFGQTKQAAQAQFVIAMLYDQLSQSEEKGVGSRDSAISAFALVREQYRQSPYFRIADGKLAAAGIKPKPKSKPPTVPAMGQKQVQTANQTPTADTASGPAKKDSSSVPSKSPALVGDSPELGPSPNMGANSNNGSSHNRDDESSESGKYRGDVSDSGEERPDPGATIDSSSYQPEGKTKEELDNGYENVDQY